MAAVLLRPILRDACWRKLLQDEVVLYGTPSDPRGEERGKAARLRTMLHIAGRTMRPVSGKLDRPGIPDRAGDGRRATTARVVARAFCYFSGSTLSAIVSSKAAARAQRQIRRYRERPSHRHRRIRQDRADAARAGDRGHIALGGSRMTSAAAPRVDRAPFGTMPDGMAVERVTLRGADGFEASVITYGAALQSLTTRDRVGRSEDVVFGHDDLESYLAARRFFGATIGRYANRIARARCMLDGTELRLDANNGANMLHGGHDGFDRKLWRIVDLA